MEGVQSLGDLIEFQRGVRLAADARKSRPGGKSALDERARQDDHALSRKAVGNARVRFGDEYKHNWIRLC